MTLEEHFGLIRPPFPRSAPDPALLRHPGVEQVLTRLHFALERDAIAMLIAESGCGKSTVLSLFARSLDTVNYHLIATSLTTLAPFGFLASLCAATGLKTVRFKSETAAILISHLRGLPKKTVLLIDEAHLLPDDSLEDLRLLTADDFDRRPPFALMLAGQPLLRERLAEPRHYALSQRIAVRTRLRPLSETETALFLDRHLKAAGAKQNPFSPEATTTLFHHSRGVPRLLQNLALQALLNATAADQHDVDQSCVEQAVVDLEEL
jgi:type II secretory pathway predicted ATPase ExeA